MRNAIILALGLAAGVPCFGTLTSFNVSLDMSALPTGTYSFDFQMVDGDGVTNNTVNVSSFVITDTLMGVLSLTGGASGTLATTLALPDNDVTMDGFSDATQQFSHTVGSGALSFVFSYDPSYAGGIPDEFSFSILDSGLNSIVSNPASNGGMIQLDFNATPAPLSFAADNSFGSIDAILTESTPEPASIALTGAGGALVAPAGISPRQNTPWRNIGSEAAALMERSLARNSIKDWR